MIKNKNMAFAVIISVLLMVVFVSGCTDSSSTELTKTFSNGGINFNYPDDWFNMPYENGSLDNDAQVLGLVGPGNLECDLTIQKIQDSTAKEVKKYSMDFFKANYNAKVISEKTVKVNGMNAYKVVYTQKETDDEETKCLTYFIQKGSATYAFEFEVYSLDNFDKYEKIFTEIMDTVK